MYSFHRFKALPPEVQIDLLNAEAIPLDLAYSAKSTEAVLFAYNDFYVELVAEKNSDEILAIIAFKNIMKLEPYLNQIDIKEINLLLTLQ